MDDNLQRSMAARLILVLCYCGSFGNIHQCIQNQCFAIALRHVFLELYEGAFLRLRVVQVSKLSVHAVDDNLQLSMTVWPILVLVYCGSCGNEVAGLSHSLYCGRFAIYCANLTIAQCPLCFCFFFIEGVVVFITGLQCANV